MRAMILAAGKGTRLAPLTDKTPKPMLPLAGVPLIERQVKALAAAGVEQIVINPHHLSEKITDHLGDGARFGIEVRYSHEHQILETGGGIVKALPLLDYQPFWLLNGDIWTDFPFDTLPQKPASPDLAHLVLTPRPASRAKGDFTYADGRVLERGHDYVYCGIAALDPALFAGIDPTFFSLRDLYFEAINQQRLSAQVHLGQWHDIGTPEEYRALAAKLESA